MSEEYDAAVVIVSEESGQISIAYQSNLYRGLQDTEMRQLLQQIFRTGGAGEEEVSVKDWWRQLTGSGPDIEGDAP